MTNGVTEKISGWYKDSCELARHNREKFVLLQEAHKTLAGSQKEDIQSLYKVIKEINDELKNRIPVTVTIIISVLCAVVGFLAKAAFGG